MDTTGDGPAETTRPTTGLGRRMAHLILDHDAVGGGRSLRAAADPEPAGGPAVAEEPDRYTKITTSTIVLGPWGPTCDRGEAIYIGPLHPDELPLFRTPEGTGTQTPRDLIDDLICTSVLLDDDDFPVRLDAEYHLIDLGASYITFPVLHDYTACVVVQAPECETHTL